MATQNLTTADAILKDLYVGPIIEQLNYKTYMIDKIEREDPSTVQFAGRRAIVPVHKSRNRGRGSRGDAGALPTAGVQGWEDAIINVKQHYQGIELSDLAIESTKSNEGAFVSLLDGEVKGAANDMRKDINRQVFGDGTGLLATVAATLTTTLGPITVDSIQYLHIGDPVDLLRITDGNALGSGSASNSVAALSASGKTVTLNTVVAGTIPVTTGIYVEGNYGQEMDGLKNIVSTSRTLHSINSATAGNEFWNGNVRNVGTQAASPQVAGESSFELISDDVGQTGQGETSVYITTRGIRRRLADTFQSQKRFTNKEAVSVHGGYSAIMVSSGQGEVPVVIDDDCPKGNVFAIDTSALRWFQLASPGWMERDDGGIFHLKDGATAGSKVASYQAWMRWYSALGSVAPNRLGKLQYATDDDPSVTA